MEEGKERTNDPEVVRHAREDLVRIGEERRKRDAIADALRWLIARALGKEYRD